VNTFIVEDIDEAGQDPWITPGTGKTHLATGIAIRACQAGHRVQFATASQWVDRLAAAHAAGTLRGPVLRL
jgi:DNA replication protein DnaC